MAEKSNQQLLDVLAQPADWTPEALEAAKAELAKRNIRRAPAPPQREMLCPDCQGTLESSDGQMAHCTLHPAAFKILFSHWQPPPVAPPPDITYQPVGDVKLMCAAHPNVATNSVCAACGTPICDTCAFPGQRGRKLCLSCLPNEPASPAGPASLAPPLGTRCRQHPSVQATQKCKLCGSFMCPTCDFLMPGNVHVCPVCATAPRPALSPRRKKYMIASFVLAVIATVGMAVIMSGAFAGMAHNKDDLQALGVLFMVIVLVPALAGMGMGFTAIDRRLTNPMSLWIATIWNLLIVGGFLLLCVIGNLK
jgi:hypothetical protein